MIRLLLGRRGLEWWVIAIAVAVIVLACALAIAKFGGESGNSLINYGFGALKSRPG